jgi:enterochelin esterase-like enzyme
VPITSRYLGNSRVLSVYLPPDYASQPQQRFKVLYSNDGQDLPTLGLEQYLDGFYASNQMEQIIVVGIPSNDNRVYEYGTGSIKDADGLGAEAQAYLFFLLKEVIPLIDSKYRTLSGPTNTGYMGWSLGALTAFYASWQHPDVFGIVGSISGSYWWRTDVSSLGALLDSRVIQKMVRESTTHPALRMWFSVGTAEDPNDRDKNGVIDMVQDTTDLLAELTQKGYQDGVDFVYEQVEGGTHDLASFTQVLPDFLRWAFPPK